MAWKKIEEKQIEPVRASKEKKWRKSDGTTKSHQNGIQPIQTALQTTKPMHIEQSIGGKKRKIDNRMIIIRKVYVYSRITIKSPLFTQRTVEYINTT